MTDTERRNKGRVKGHIRVGYGKEEPCIYDLSEDLSLKGVFLRTPYPLDLNTDLNIEIHFKPKRSKETISLELKGQVRRIISQSEADKENSDLEAGMGIEFIDLSDEQKSKLQKIIENL